VRDSLPPGSTGSGVSAHETTIHVTWSGKNSRTTVSPHRSRCPCFAQPSQRISRASPAARATHCCGSWRYTRALRSRHTPSPGASRPMRGPSAPGRPQACSGPSAIRFSRSRNSPASPPVAVPLGAL